VSENSPGAAARASGRAKGEIARVRDVRFGPGQAVLAGIFIGWVGIATKAALNEAIGGDTGYIILMAGAVLAAWAGGLAGGLAAIITSVVLTSVIFASADDSTVDQFRQILFLVIATATVWLVASRRAARDGLVDALDEVASLAEEVEARDARLEMMLAASGTGFWEWEIETGELVWSAAIFRQHGMEPGPRAPAYATYIDSIHPDDRQAFESATTAAIEGSGSFALDFRIVWPDGTVHWTHGAGRVFRDETGKAVRMIGTGQDITEQRRLIEDRDRLLAEEHRAGEFREAFVDVISHELRTPITTIMGLAQILARPGRADDEASRAALLEDVRSESERLHRLVEDLLVLSRIERGRLEVDPEPLEPRRLLERAVAHEARELTSITVQTDLEPDLPIVAGEATYIEQIVRNLLGNAAKYTPPGSHVVVSARKRDGQIEVRVSDNGPGIPVASIERIFELFYRDPESARAVAGSGIGLFVCATLIEAMGGRIWASRRPEGGSEFGFTLRTIEPDEIDADANEESAAASARSATPSARSAADRDRPAVRETPTPAG
jgi:signal transduction histidine kinase